MFRDVKALQPVLQAGKTTEDTEITEKMKILSGVFDMIRSHSLSSSLWSLCPLWFFPYVFDCGPAALGNKVPKAFPRIGGIAFRN